MVRCAQAFAGDGKNELLSLNSEALVSVPLGGSASSTSHTIPSQLIAMQLIAMHCALCYDENSSLCFSGSNLDTDFRKAFEADPALVASMVRCLPEPASWQRAHSSLELLEQIADSRSVSAGQAKRWVWQGQAASVVASLPAFILAANHLPTDCPGAIPSTIN